MRLKQNRWYEVEIRDLSGTVLEKVKFFAVEKEQTSGRLSGSVKEVLIVSRFERIKDVMPSKGS